MAVHVAIVARKEALEHLLEVVLGARPRLHQRQACRGVRHERVEKPVAAALAGEALEVVGDVDDPSAVRVQLEFDRAH